MTHCTNHCSACGSHFSSVKAFDAHRVGDHESGRYCEDPEDIADRDGNPRLAARDGEVCALTRPPRIGVKVWTDAKSLQAARRRWAS